MIATPPGSGHFVSTEINPGDAIPDLALRTDF
jgi:hypothetical protein